MVDKMPRCLLYLTVIAIALNTACDDGSPSTIPDPTASPAPHVLAPVTRPTAALTPSAASAMLPQPRAVAGPGWTFEVKVADLTALDLAVAITEGPAPNVQLIDLDSGWVVAAGSFGGNPFVRLRDDPLQLLVSDDLDGMHRLLLLDLSASGAALASELNLPERYNYQGLANRMTLSPNGGVALVGERQLRDEEQCRGASVDGVYCYVYSLTSITLDPEPRSVTLELPERCGDPGVVSLDDFSLVVHCWQSGVVATIDASGVHTSKPYERISVEPAAGWPDSLSVEYATRLPGGEIRALFGDGSVRGEPGELISASLLPENHQLYWAEQIDDARVLVLAGERRPGGSPPGEILVVDLAEPSLSIALRTDATDLDVYVLDASTGVVLSEHDGGYALRFINFSAGTLSGTLVLRGLTARPDIITR
jgi:hypothetical protein